MPRYDVFLSHASADKPAVEHLAYKLREKSLNPFLDKWHLIPGEPWQEGMEEALRESLTCAVFIGKEIGPWQNEEMRTALAKRVKNRSYRVVPVLLPGGPKAGLDELSEFLGRLTWVDFRTGLDNEDAFRSLLAGIRGEAPGPGSGWGGGETPSLPYRCLALAREPFIQRSEYAKVRDALLAQETGRATTVGITTAIHGAGGFGKTALAIELCYDERVREQYPDGILWVQMRDNLEDDGRLKEVRDALRLWTWEEPPAFETIAKAGQHLIELLDGKRVLLVVDDVWRSADLAPFRGLSSAAALLVTTRDSRTLPRETVAVHVGAMEIPEAVRLMGDGLPAGAEDDLKTLATHLGEWPLLLKLVNRQVEGWIGKGLNLQEAIRRAENALKAKGLTYFDPKDAKDRSQAVALTLEVSLERLSKEDQERFAELSIFPGDANVPLSVLEKLWQLDSFDVEELASRSFDLSLLRSFDLHSQTIRLHDVIRAYLLKMGECHLIEWNQLLLNTYRPANGRWPELPRDEGYLWNHLFHHLIGAGQSVVCRDLLLDFQYLGSKLHATDVNALLADYSFFAEKYEELRLVRDALRLSAHVLVRNPTQLREQLWGRLLDRREAGIRGLTQACEDSGITWLKLRKASLPRPGGPLIRTIHHPGRPNALGVLPDGRVVSGSYDGTLQVWDVESGHALHSFEGHSVITALEVLDSRRVVTGSADAMLRVWDVESGKDPLILKGHSSLVAAVAVLDDRYVVSGSGDGTLRVWDTESGQALRVFETHTKVSAVVALSRHRVVYGSEKGTLGVWDVENGQFLHFLKGHSAWVSALAVLDSRRVISGSDDQTLRVWDVESGQTLEILEGHSGGVNSVGVLEVPDLVISGSYDQTLRVWDAESGDFLKVFKGQSTWPSALAVLGNSKVVTATDHGTLQVWDVWAGQASQGLEGHSKSVLAVGVLGTHRVISGSFGRTLQVWDVESGRVLQTLAGHSSWFPALAVLDSRRVVSGSHDGTLQVWDVESRQALKVLKGHSKEVSALAVLDSQRVISSSDDKTLRIWDVESGQTLKVLEGHSKAIGALAVLDSRRVISGSDDQTLRVWDVESSQTLKVLEGHSFGVSALAVLDSHRAVSGSHDWTLRVWNVESGQALQVLEGHSSWVNAVAVLDNCRVVSGSEDWTLRVWNVKSGKAECLFTLDAPVKTVAVIPDRRIIVAGDGSGRVHFFDLVES